MKLSELRKRAAAGTLVQTALWRLTSRWDEWSQDRTLITEGPLDALRTGGIAVGHPAMAAAAEVRKEYHRLLIEYMRATGCDEAEAQRRFMEVMSACSKTFGVIAEAFQRVIDAAIGVGKAMSKSMSEAMGPIIELQEALWSWRDFIDAGNEERAKWRRHPGCLRSSNVFVRFIRTRFCGRGRRRPNHGKDPLI